MQPEFRPNLGDTTGRILRHEHGWLEYRYGPGNTCEIVNIEVDSDCRREGIGRKMLEVIEEMGDVNTIYAFTRISNKPAHVWYKATGFQFFRIPGFYGPDECDHAILCVKRLTEGVKVSS